MTDYSLLITRYSLRTPIEHRQQPFDHFQVDREPLLVKCMARGRRFVDRALGQQACEQAQPVPALSAVRAARDNERPAGHVRLDLAPDRAAGGAALAQPLPDVRAALASGSRGNSNTRSALPGSGPAGRASR
mgnify:CR=1 FL=1